MRWALVLSLAFVGCVASVPNDPSISADLATETARMILVLRRGVEPPAPDAPSKECTNCNGTGKIGDGRIVMPCPECDGTGKTASLLHPTAFVPLAEASP